MLSQSAPPSCPAGRPVDDLIAEIHKQQAKKRHRNPNPIPDAICIGDGAEVAQKRRRPFLLNPRLERQHPTQPPVAPAA